MKNNHLLILFFVLVSIFSCDKSSFGETDETIQIPANLKYANLLYAREGKNVLTSAPSINTGGKLPVYELVSIRNGEGVVLDDSFTSYVKILQTTPRTIIVDPTLVRLDQFGNPIDVIEEFDTSSNGKISIAEGNKFTNGDYYFTIKATIMVDGVAYSKVFEDAFHLKVGPLLPTILIYSPKNQNLVFGDPTSKSTAPFVPNANPAVIFELATLTDKLVIDSETGVISLSPNYIYNGTETLKPEINVISKISGEKVLFKSSFIAIVSNTPVATPLEAIYFYYPTLFTTGAFPNGGDGYTSQVLNKGDAQRIWGARTNSGGLLTNVTERPANITSQPVVETTTNSSTAITTPVNAWMVTGTQDLTPFRFGYKLSFNYYYKAHFQTYLQNGATPTDMEVYISTDYTGGPLQDESGNWLNNGTWTKVNSEIKCQKAANNTSSAPTFGPEFIGTPYPGIGTGPDPDGRKTGQSFYGFWIKCSYDISAAQVTKNFTVAFKVKSFFTGTIRNATQGTAGAGRGGSFFISDFNYKAQE